MARKYRTFDSNEMHFEQQWTVIAPLNTYEAFLSATFRPVVKCAQTVS